MRLRGRALSKTALAVEWAGRSVPALPDIELLGAVNRQALLIHPEHVVHEQQRLTERDDRQTLILSTCRHIPPSLCRALSKDVVLAALVC